MTCVFRTKKLDATYITAADSIDEQVSCYFKVVVDIHSASADEDLGDLGKIIRFCDNLV